MQPDCTCEKAVCMRRKAKQTFVYALLGILVFSLYLLIENLTGNFHEVIAGEVYRSAQLEKGDILEYKQKYGIKSVLNLRGENTGEAWYDTEIAETQKAGLVHLNFRMSAGHELTNEQAVALLTVMKNAPKPLLIHCRSGADRTGLASALYVAAIAKKGEWAAERQLWIYYGHLSFYINSSFAMNRTFERLEPILGFMDS
jgi:protein tyrosine/serine phosphatase